MNATQLLAHFDRLAEAPNAVPRLRRFVLDLAVRGKLVEQDVGDEPSAKLLKRIQTDKARLVETGSVKASKPQPATEDMDSSLIPGSWRWTRLADVGFIGPRNTAPDDQLVSFVPMPMIAADYGTPNQHEVKPWREIKTGYTHFAEGDVGLAKITPCFENGKSTVFRGLTSGIGAGTTELHIVRPVLLSADYILIYLKSSQYIATGIPRMTGTAGQKRVPTEYFTQTPFPLPPLAEQHRIVAKVDELMALCDQLEAAQQERERRRDRLAAASLQRLNQPAADTFPEAQSEHARFHLHHLPRLTARPEHIKAMRQTILNLAVRGLLLKNEGVSVPKPVALKPDAQSAAGIDSPVFSEALASMSVPSHWGIFPLASVSEEIVDCPHSTPVWAQSGKICVRTNQFRPGYLDLSNVRFVSQATYAERILRLAPRENDILYSREGGILGVACRVPAHVELCLGQRMMLIRAGKTIAPIFLELVLNSPLITEIARGRTTGGAAPRVNVATVKAYPIPLPPLGEQHRIVAKVDELMALCDQLEVQLTTTQTDSRCLLEAVLEAALKPA